MAPPVPEIDLRPLPPGLLPLTRVFVRFYFSLLHRIELRGHERCPDSGPLIVMSNHPTYMDPWIVGLGLTRRYVHWMAWDAILGWPVVGRAVKAYRVIPVNLERPRPSMFKAAHDVLARGLTLGIFPEAGRSGGRWVEPFKPGAARIALSTGTRILPVSIRGGFDMWPKTRALPRPGPKLVVTYHDPVAPGAVTGQTPRAREEKLTKLLHETIASAV